MNLECERSKHSGNNPTTTDSAWIGKAHEIYFVSFDDFHFAVKFWCNECTCEAKVD